MIKWLSPEGKQANLAPLEEMHSPFGGWRHHLSPASGGTITRAYCRAIYEKIVSRCFILPPEQGWQGNTIRKGAKRPENRVTRFPVEKSGAARIGGGERSEPISRIVFHAI